MRRLASGILISLGVIATLATPMVSFADDTTTPAAEQRAQRLAEQFAGRDASDSAVADQEQPANIEQQSLGAPDTGADSQALPKAKQDGSSWLLSTLGSLGVVIGLILLLRWGWLKVGGQPTARPSAVVEVLSRTSVAPRNHVLLLRVGGRVLIVSDSPGGMRTLADITEPEEVADLLAAVSTTREGSISKGFQQIVTRFQGDYESSDPDIEGADSGEHRIDRAREALSGALSRVRAMAAGRGVA